MQAVVVHPGTTKDALNSRKASSLLKANRLESVLLPSQTLTAEERIAVYQEMYPLRMRDALASDYPALEHFLGERFRDFVTAYTKKHPSMGYTLNRLGDRVPDFLGRQTRLKPAAFLKDLARLELAVTEAFDSAEAKAMRPGELEGIRPARLGSVRLRTVPSLRLMELDWNAGEFLDSLRDDDHRHPKPRRSHSFVTIVRRNYSVYRSTVSEPEFAVLTDLQSGLTIGKAVERGLARRGPRRPLPDQFGVWFRTWTSQGFFESEVTGPNGGKKVVPAPARRAHVPRSEALGG